MMFALLLTAVTTKGAEVCGLYDSTLARRAERLHERMFRLAYGDVRRVHVIRSQDAVEDIGDELGVRRDVRRDVGGNGDSVLHEVCIKERKTDVYSDRLVSRHLRKRCSCVAFCCWFVRHAQPCEGCNRA